MIEHSAILTIEFLGLPGVGKSALSARIGAILRERGLCVREPIRRLSDRSHPRSSLHGYAGKMTRVLQEVLSHPIRSWRAIQVIRRSGQRSLQATFKITINWLLQCSISEARLPGTCIHLLDEGFYQALWSLGLDGCPGVVSRAGPPLLASVAVPDVVVVVRAEPETVGLRLSRRLGRSRADRWQQGDRETFARAESLLTEVESLLDGSGPGIPHRIRVDNGLERDPEEAAQWVADEIGRMVRTTPQVPLRRGLLQLPMAILHRSNDLTIPVRARRVRARRDV